MFRFLKPKPAPQPQPTPYPSQIPELESKIAAMAATIEAMNARLDEAMQSESLREKAFRDRIAELESENARLTAALEASKSTSH
jgi:predicted RNase H-like nuclease (RuvC/YqgF family)